MAAPELDRLLDAVGRAAATLPEAQAAWLFGSHASGRAHAASDIDVAFLLDDVTAPTDGRARLRRVLEALTRNIAADRLDVVILNGAPPALAFQVLKHGKRAFASDRIALQRFAVSTYRRHSDFQSTERFFREATRRRALAESRGG